MGGGRGGAGGGAPAGGAALGEVFGTGLTPKPRAAGYSEGAALLHTAQEHHHRSRCCWPAGGARRRARGRHRRRCSKACTPAQHAMRVQYRRASGRRRNDMLAGDRDERRHAVSIGRLPFSILAVGHGRDADPPVTWCVAALADFFGAEEMPQLAAALLCYLSCPAAHACVVGGRTPSQPREVLDESEAKAAPGRARREAERRRRGGGEVAERGREGGRGWQTEAGEG